MYSALAPPSGRFVSTLMYLLNPGQWLGTSLGQLKIDYDRRIQVPHSDSRTVQYVSSGTA